MAKLPTESTRERLGYPSQPGWRQRAWEIIFETETPAGRRFDVALLMLIVVSVATVMIESVDSLQREFGSRLRALEWIVTVLFTLEYGTRLCVSDRPGRYARSFFGVVDLLAILPTWLSLVLPGAHSLAVIRGLRLLRTFRVLKLAQFLTEANVLLSAVRAGRNKVFVFIGTVILLAILLGTAMYLIEGREHGFTSIPRSIYWAVVTMTTVGYGDITPQTVPGQLLAVVVMLLGYGIIAVPTGIVTSELIEASRTTETGDRRVQTCPACSAAGHPREARYCHRCAQPLVREPQPDRR